jgi:hypothetical protein
MPCDAPNLRSQLALRPNYKVNAIQNESLDTDIEVELSCLFEKEIALYRVIEEIKQNL